jgi:hypothetical protein
MTEPEPTRPWYQHKVFLPAALALVLLVIAALVAMASSRPPAELTAAPEAAAPVRPAAEQAFLDDVHASTSDIARLNTDDQLLILGQWNCDKLRTLGAASFKAVVDEYVARGYPLTGVSFVNISMNHFCPEIWNQFGGTAPALATPAVAAPAAAPTTPPGTFGPGTYQVGSDIPPGNYRSTGPDGSNAVGCYYARLKHNDGAAGDIIANNISKGQSLLTIKASDGYVSISGCSFAKK